MIINLIDNAIKYTDSGSITVQVQAIADNRLHCVVNDTGPGLSDELQTQLFQPFARSQQVTESAIPGSGLGLSISKRLVELMGGHITITSTATGTQVAVELPFAPVRAVPPIVSLRSIPPHETSTGVHYRALVVDDEIDERRVMETFLQNRGLAVVTAKSGTEALVTVATNRPDIMFIDLRMPGLNGADTVTRIRQQEAEGVRVPIIAVTADALPENRQRLLAAGCDEVIFKPYRLTQIAAILGQHLNITLAQAPEAEPETILTTAMLSSLPHDWLWPMYEICVAGHHEDALAHLRLIDETHPELAAQMARMISAFWTTRIADLIAPLLD